jgi:hypothetical protein
MNARDDFGVSQLLRDVKRRTDWVEPFPEGDHILVAKEAGGDD